MVWNHELEIFLHAFQFQEEPEGIWAKRIHSRE